MLTMRQKQALTATITRRYAKSRKKEKTQILDEFVRNTGYNRSYARRLLKHSQQLDFRRKRRKPTRRVTQRVYDKAVLKPLTQIWVTHDFICGKRLHSRLPETMRLLERDGELVLTDETRNKLKQISPATIDRLLQPVRQKTQLKGRSGTKPGSLLKSQIPIRTFADWDDNRPGFFEIDLVAYCGARLQGEFIWGLNFTDVETGWVGLDAVAGKGQRGIHSATKRIQGRLVFKMLGIDSDNGSEFINNIMRRFCEYNQITFTRIRPGKKNDNCFVEQKNYTVLRNFLGYSRYDTEPELKIIRQLLILVETYVNFYQPSQKLVYKQRDGAKIYKRHDRAKTPYQRLLKSGILRKSQRRKLHEIYDGENPMKLLKKIRQKQAKLSKLNRYKLVEATNR